MSVLGVSGDALIPELGLLLGETGLDVLGVTMLVAALFGGNDVVLVLFWQDLTIVDRLDGGVVMVLVNLLVNSSGDVLVLGALDVLVGHGGSDTLVYGGVMMTSLSHEVFDGCLRCKVNMSVFQLTR